MAEQADAADLKVRGALGFSEMASATIQQWRRAAAPPRPMPASLFIPSLLSKGAPCHTFAKNPRPPYAPEATVVAQRAWRNGRRSGLEENLSARPETGDAELPKFGETSHMAIPSQARSQPNREGVETRRAAPNPGLGFTPGMVKG